jgi:long-chain acyl-CoA synthetase
MLDLPRRSVSLNLLPPFTVSSRELTGGICIFDGRTVARIPFLQLHEDILQARRRLEGAGIEQGMCVGIVGENCYEWIVYDLALCSLDVIPVCFPKDEFSARSAEELADEFDLSLLLVTKKGRYRTDLPWIIAMDVPTMNTAAAVRRNACEGKLLRRIRGTDVCTVIFSSGTSGQLKTLLLSRAGVDVTIDALANDWELGRADGILVALPLSIFQQRLMVYAALRKDTHILLTDPANLFRGFKALRPTVVLGPPALFETIENRFHSLPPVRRQFARFGSGALAVVPGRRWKQSLRRRLFHSTHEALGGRVRILLTGSAPSKLSTLRFFQSAGLSLFQAYGLAEIGFIAWNRPGRNRFLSVGRPLIPGSVTLAEDGEIIVSVSHPQAIGYLGVDRTEEARTFLPDGGIATGDIGRFDRAGFLYITGRKKSVILLQSGEKISPESLELQLGTPAGVNRVVVIGGDMAGLGAIVAVDPDCAAEEEARIRSAVWAAIERVNGQVKHSSHIVRFLITRVPFDVGTGLVTRNLKVDRAAVQRRFAAELGEHGLSANKVHIS